MTLNDISKATHLFGRECRQFRTVGDFEVLMTDVTIGLAVYNGAATVAAALSSIVTQTYKDLKVVILDNASTDGTQEICERFAKEDSRVRYERLATTIHVQELFHIHVRQANTPFFMWAAADDLWAPDFVATHRQFLVANPDYVLSQSRVLFHAGGVPTRMAIGTYPLRQSAKANAARFFANPADNSRFYGLFRTEPLQAAYPTTILYAFDWMVSGATIKYGKHHEDPRILMVRDETPADLYPAAVARYTRSWLSRLFPILPLVGYILKRRPVPFSPSLLWSLFRLNLRIAVRFATLRLYSAARRDGSAVEQRPRLLRPLAHATSRIFAPGMSERLRLAVSAANSAAQTLAGRYAPGLADKLLNTALLRLPRTEGRKSFGWRKPTMQHTEGELPSISVIIVAENQLHDILTILDQLPVALGDRIFETVIVDNASTDATALLLATRPDVRYLRRQTRLPFAAAAREAAAIASAERLLFLDPALLLHQGTIRVLADALDQAEIAGPLCVTANGAICARGGALTLDVESIFLNQGYALEEAQLQPTYEVDFCPFAFAIRRKTWDACGGLHGSWCTFTAASAELGSHVKTAGGRVLIDPRSVVTVPPVAGEHAGATQSQNELIREWPALMLAVGRASTE